MEKGRCLCGGVSFEAEVADHGFHACHCRMVRARFPSTAHQHGQSEAFTKTVVAASSTI